MRGRIGLVLNSFALASGLFLVGETGIARAQQRMPQPNVTSFSPGVYRAGPVGGIQQYNPAWRSNGQPASVYNNNYGYGINNYNQYGANGAQPYVVNGPYGGYAANNGFGGVNGYGNGGAWNGGGWSITNWPVPYAVPGATGNAYIQLPSYGFSGMTNGTGYGVARYGSFSNQAGAFGIPFGRSYGTTGSYTGASAFGW